MITFTRPRIAGNELRNLKHAIENSTPWGGNFFFNQATSQLRDILGAQQVLITQSCTSALELAALAIQIGPGDEVIVPSYTFVSTASAFALRGAQIKFADILPTTLNIDPEDVRKLITSHTKAIVVVHYGGVACDMDEIMKIAAEAGVLVIEDAAQGIGSSYKGQPLGTIGDLGCVSFHGTKNISSGEGGALIINNPEASIIEAAQLSFEKGTDRRAFLAGEVDKYTWKSLGSSFIPSEYTCAVLSAQLEELNSVSQERYRYWASYSSSLRGAHNDFSASELKQDVEGSNHHMFGFLAESPNERAFILSELFKSGVKAASHYQPLHDSPFALQHIDPNPRRLEVTEDVSGRLVRLPMWSGPGLEVEEVAWKLSMILDTLK